MAWVSPKSSLGVTTVTAGSSVRIFPESMLDGLLWVAAVSLTETASNSDLKKNAKPPPGTTGWLKKKLTKDIGFEINDRARGEVNQDLGGGEVVVDFKFVSAVIGKSDFE